MKNNPVTAKALTGTLVNPRRFLVAMLLSALGSFCQAQPSPVGTWDCVIKGRQNGTARVTFQADSSIDGFKIVVPRRSEQQDVLAFFRSVGGTRDPDPASGGGGSVIDENEFGSFAIVGNWASTPEGRLIGFFAELAQNLSGEWETNEVSFRGSVRPGSRLLIVATGPNGRTVIKGVPAQTLSDLSGSWTATGKKNGAFLAELFTLSPTGDANLYELSGAGAAYTLDGSALVSAQRRISFMISEFRGTNQVIRALTGPFSFTRMRASTKGVDSSEGRLKYRATKQ